MSLYESRVSQAEEAAAAKDHELTILRDQLKRLRDDYEYNVSLIEDRDADLDKLEADNETLKKEVATISEREATTQADYERRCSALSLSLDTLRSSEAQLQAENTALSARAAAAESARVDEVASVRALLESTTKALNDKLKRVQADAEERIQRVRQDHDRIAAEREAVYDAASQAHDEEIGVARARASRLEEEVTSLRGLLEEREALMTGMRRQKTDAETKLAGERAEHDRSVEDYEAALKGLRAHAEEWRGKADAATAEAARAARARPGGLRGRGRGWMSVKLSSRRCWCRWNSCEPNTRTPWSGLRPTSRLVRLDGWPRNRL
jgi:chromosome segregation ATPase